jgi:hypothetical protein
VFGEESGEGRGLRMVKTPLQAVPAAYAKEKRSRWGMQWGLFEMEGRSVIHSDHDPAADAADCVGALWSQQQLSCKSWWEVRMQAGGGLAR